MGDKYQKNLFVYEEIRKNKIKTGILILVFVLIILVLSVAIGYYMGDVFQGLTIGVIATIIVVPINLLTSKFFITSATRGRLIDLDNPEHLKVKNLIEGLCLSAGLKDLPEIYLLPTKIPNAFTGGFSPKTAYVGVTQGLLDVMNDSELEGVLAHEISHIVQHDVLISTVSVSLLSVAIILGDMLYRLSYYGARNRSRSSKNSENQNNLGSVIMMVSVAAVILSFFIRLIGNLVNLAISRKREYSADANAVRLCGYSVGLASALEKLSGLSNREKYSKNDLSELGGENLMGLYIFNPLKSFSALFLTHPPIEERINKLKNMY